MSTTTLHAPAKPAGALLHTCGFVWRWLRAAHRTSVERRALLDLDDHILADIGLDRHGVRAEADRPFWDLPDTTRLQLGNGGRF